MSDDEMEDIIEIVKSLEDSDSGLLLKLVSETTQNEAKEQKGGFLSVVLGTLGASLLGNMLAGKRAIAASQRWGVNRAREGEIEKRQGWAFIRAVYGPWDFLSKSIFNSTSSFN